jgi:hypothetical protein
MTDTDENVDGGIDRERNDIWHVMASVSILIPARAIKTL